MADCWAEARKLGGRFPGRPGCTNELRSRQYSRTVSLCSTVLMVKMYAWKAACQGKNTNRPHQLPFLARLGPCATQNELGVRLSLDSLRKSPPIFRRLSPPKRVENHFADELSPTK